MSLPFTHPPDEVLPHGGSAVLHSGFLDAPRADALLTALLDEIPWQSHDIVLFGRKVAEPRLSSWIGDPGVSYVYSGIRRDPIPWTPHLLPLRDACEAATGTRFNSVLANLYRDGEDAMGWHADDEPELGPTPVIASVSLGEERRFDFRHRDSAETKSVVLPHGSLLVMSGATQSNWKHRIARSKAVRGPRVNLTFRLIVA